MGHAYGECWRDRPGHTPGGPKDEEGGCRDQEMDPMLRAHAVHLPSTSSLKKTDFHEVEERSTALRSSVSEKNEPQHPIELSLHILPGFPQLFSEAGHCLQ